MEIPSIQAGDRFDLGPLSTAFLPDGCIPIDVGIQTILAEGDAGIVLQGSGEENGRALTFDPSRGVLQHPQLKALATGGACLTLECITTAPLLFHLRVEPGSQVPPLAEPAGQPTGVRFEVDPSDVGLLDGTIPRAPLRNLHVSMMALRLGMVAGFDELLSLSMVREVEPYEYQLRTVKTVLRRLRGRALLCDEVGLGKTVEAGLVLLELIARGLVRRVLVLTPPSLVEQWRGELQRKFGLPFAAYDDPEFREEGVQAWAVHDKIIASYHTAKRDPHRAAITAHTWDMVIIDEVHHFRNRSTRLWQFASELSAKYILCLTATPVQNDLNELFNIVTLLQPGLLSTARTFQKQFVDKGDKLMPLNVEHLHRLLSEVMVRNRRSTTGIVLTHRIARTETVTLTEPERRLYERVSAFVHAQLRAGGNSRGLSRMSLLTLQRELGSSARAAAHTLERLADHAYPDPRVREALLDMARVAIGLQDSGKIGRLFRIINEVPDKLIIFTQFRRTLDMLREALDTAGLNPVVFHGGLTRMEREEAIRMFRDETRILISTDAGSEGRNLQFCNAICNFDLPWNPMKIEQRIGRLSRIGQKRDVQVYNLVAADTLEAAILHLLAAKIAMFELVVGEIDMIIGNLDQEDEFEDVITDLWITSDDDAQFRHALEKLGDRLADAKEAYGRQKALEESLFGEHFAAEG
jgi:SNF2 family DNA or RNA helicase